MPLKILLNGAKGRMGLAIVECAPANDASIVASCDFGDDASALISGAEVVIDFSWHEATLGIATLAARQKLPLVIGTTGHTQEERSAILAAIEGEIPVVWAGNYSVGVNTLNFLTRKAASILGKDYEAEILEMHHHHKKDAPSGTAERLIEILKQTYEMSEENVIHGREGLIGARPNNQIGVHAIRGGDIVGEHTVYFIGQGERLELSHKATDRKIFAQGAIRAAHWVVGKSPSVYNMEDVLGLIDTL